MPPDAPSARETLTSLIIVALLAVIALGLFFVQRRPGPAVRVLAEAGSTVPGTVAGPNGQTAGPPADGPVPVPEGFAAMGPAEVYDPRRLSDKIDGKAELYLSAGVRRLTARRLTTGGERGAWLEVFVYEMTSPKAAYAVYSAQQRQGAEPTGVARFSYRTQNALFFVHGEFYVEIVSAQTGPSSAVRLVKVAEAFVEAHPAVETAVVDRDLFPAEGLVSDSIALQSSDVFGFQGLDDVFSARYRIEEKELTAFVSRRASETAAKELAAAYVSFLVRFGGRAETVAVPAPGAHLVEVFGVYDLVFVRGEILAGVHEAEDRRHAELLGKRLWRRISGETP